MKVVLYCVFAVLISSSPVNAGANVTDYLTKAMTVQVGNNRPVDISIGNQGTYVFDCEYLTGTLYTNAVLYKYTSFTVADLLSDRIVLNLPYQGSNGKILGKKTMASPPACNYARSTFSSKTKKDIYYDGTTFDVVYR